jgi:hypothetical protein
MRIRTTIFLSVMIGIVAMSAGILSGWNSGVNDGKSLYQCTTTP